MFRLLSALLVAVWAQAVHAVVELGSVRQSVSVEGFTENASDSDAITSNLGGSFDEFVEIEVDNGTIIASADLNSFVGAGQDPTTVAISGNGEARTSLWVQGFADGQARADVQADFRMTADGGVEINGTMFVGQYEWTTARPGDARVIFAIADLGTRTLVFTKVVRIDGPSFFEFEDDTIVNLEAGEYRVLIRAVIDDVSDAGTQVDESFTFAQYQIDVIAFEN